MADQHRRNFDDDDRRDFGPNRERAWQEPFHSGDERERASHRPDHDERPRSGRQMEGGSGSGGYRYGNDGGYYPAPPRDYRQSGRDGQYSGGWTDESPRRNDPSPGQNAGPQWGGASSAGRGYAEADFHPHHVEDSRYRDRGQAGPSSDWRGSGVVQNRDGVRSGYRSGNADWSTGGGHGGATSFEPLWHRPEHSGRVEQRAESYAGRGPKNYRRSDDRIREDASDRLQDDPEVDASDITVQVLDAEVTLTGTVNSRDQKRRAEDCVERVSGVREVSNHLRINRPGGQQAPSGAQSDDSLFEVTGKLKEESRGKS